MPNSYPFAQFILFNGTISEGTLTWTNAGSIGEEGDLIDVNSDGNLDIGVDTVLLPSTVFSGFLWTAPNGSVYPIFQNQVITSEFYLPYHSSQYSLTGLFPYSGSTSQYSDNAVAYPLCFAAGTLIATPTGEVAVETLQTGDLILTAAGDPEPVRWLARQTVMTRFRPAERLLPVRFAAGALGHGLPHSDLTVTADHALLIDGILCHAGALVNGTSITRVPLAELGDSFTVYHIETAAHEIILANGAATETFIDNVSRRSFDNYAEFQALYGDSLHMAELPLPRAVSARQVPQDIRTRLTDRHVA